MSYLKTLNSFLPILKISLCKYKGFIHLWSRKLIFVKSICSPVRLRSERIMVLSENVTIEEKKIRNIIFSLPFTEMMALQKYIICREY